MKKRPRAKSAPRSKPERKPKGAKGPPKSKRGSKGKAPEKKPAIHPEPTEHAGPGKLDQMYGGFTLRLYDHDKKGAPPAVYEGKLRDVIFPPEKPIPVPAATSPGAGPAASSRTVTDGDTQLIAKLQRHLWSLGFRVFPREVKGDGVEPVISGVFDWRTEWAVREFQIAAAMPNVAVQDVKKEPTEAECRTTGKYLASLSATKNACDFKGSPNGVVDAATRDALKLWLAKNYRCPLVIQAMQEVLEPARKGKKPMKKIWVIHTENLWCHDEVPHTAQRMFAWDFSEHFKLPEGRTNERISVGQYKFYLAWCGPASYPDKGQCWKEAQLSPAILTGQSWAEMGAKEKSTFRAVAAVGAQECLGYLDSVNFYDNCHGSAGPCHWTMPKEDGKAQNDGTRKASGGEFSGFMALLERDYPDAFKKCFSNFGLWGAHWAGVPAADGRSPVSCACATYTGYVYTIRHAPKDLKSQFEQHPSETRSFAETNWLRSWQWAYRLEMAARTCAEYREAMWKYACLRIEGIRDLNQVDAWLPSSCRAKADQKITLGEVVTSERGMAALLRLHVRFPLGLVKGKNAFLRKALKQVMASKSLKDEHGKPLKWEIPPSQWTTEHEVALVDALVSCTNAKQRVTVEQARYWPLAFANGKILVKEEKIGTKVKSTPLFAKSASWIPDGSDPVEFASSEERGSFKPLK